MPAESAPASPAIDIAQDAEHPTAARARRLAHHEPRLRAALRMLYGDTQDFEAWFAGLIAMIEDVMAARSPALTDLDRRREADPNWFLRADMLGYSAYVDRFAGTLAGLRGRIDYLEGLGVRYLHLLPFWKARAGDNDGGFAVSDYAAVRPDLGDIAQIETLTEALRAAHISLCVDLVLNHTADDHPWAVAARAGDPRHRAFFHVLADQAQVAAHEAHLPQIFPETAPGNFTYCEAMGGWVWTTFYPFQWDLNWANPQVFAEMVGVILGLANRGVEAFRLDSAAFLWKRLGGPCRGEPETHLVLQALRAVVAIAAPAVLLKSEVIAPVAETAQFLGSEAAPECHLTYHSGLMTAGWAALAEGHAGLIRAVMAAAPAIPRGTGWITYVRCHDDIGWMTLAPQAGETPDQAEARLNPIAEFYTSGGSSFARGVRFQAADGALLHGLNGMTASLAGLETANDTIAAGKAIDRIALLHGVAFAAGGLPVIYMGDELGQLNDEAYRADPTRRHEGRWLHRPPFDDALASQSRDPQTIPGKIRARLLALAQARRRIPALTPETAPQLLQTGSDAVLGFRRGPAVVALFNFSGETQIVDLGGDAARAQRDLLTGDFMQGRIALAPYGMIWLEAVE